MVSGLLDGSAVPGFLPKMRKIPQSICMLKLSLGENVWLVQGDIGKNRIWMICTEFEGDETHTTTSLEGAHHERATL